MEPSSQAVAYARAVVTTIAPTDNFDVFMNRVKWVAVMFEKFQQEALQQKESE